MRKYYFEPLLEIRKYRLTPDIFTDSEKDLGDGDDFELDAAGAPVDDLFAD